MTDVASSSGPTMVTPEAVALDLPPANVGSRLFAFILDWLLITTAAGLLTYGFVSALRGVNLGVGWVIAGFVLLYGGLVFGYPVACETLWRGRTLGKAALGLRVVTIEGAPVQFRHAAIRAALGMVELVLTGGAVAVLGILLTRRHQRVGDLVAGTLVLRERTGLRAPMPMAFTVPNGMEPYAATLDVTALTAQDYTAVRTYLMRAATLSPQLRWWLSEQLATPVATRVRPAPPAGVSAEPWLACVAAVYQAGRAGWSPPPPSPPPPPPGVSVAGASPWAPPPRPSPPPSPLPRTGSPSPPSEGSDPAPQGGHTGDGTGFAPPE